MNSQATFGHNYHEERVRLYGIIIAGILNSNISDNDKSITLAFLHLALRESAHMELVDAEDRRRNPLAGHCTDSRLKDYSGVLL